MGWGRPPWLEGSPGGAIMGGGASGRKGVCWVDDHSNCENQSENENGQLAVDTTVETANG